MRAAAEDFDVTRLMGIRANGVIATAFALSGLLAAIAAMLWIAQRSSVDPLMGLIPVLKAFIATTMGGLGSLLGAVLGGLLLGAIEIYLAAYLPDSALPFHGAITLGLVIVVLVRAAAGAGRPDAARLAQMNFASRIAQGRNQPCHGQAERRRSINYKLEGEGPETIVLINGLADDLETWVEQMPDFLAAGYRVLRFDNRGIGKSGRPRGPYTTAQMAADAKALVDHLEASGTSTSSASRWAA